MFTLIISCLSVLVSSAVAIAVLLRNRRSLIHRVFALGMGLFAMQALYIALCSQASSAEDILYWQLNRLFVSSLLPGVWLVFSLTFARANYRKFLSQWKWIIASSLIVGPSLTTVFREYLFVGSPIIDGSSAVFLRLGWSGYSLSLSCLIVGVLVLANLERTFRISTGHSRWQIKFMVLGLAGLFAVRIYIDSQAVLFSLARTNFEVVSALALLLACLMIAKSLFRTRMLEFNFYLSHSFLHNSFTILVVGAYFVVVGAATRLAYHFEGLANPSVVAFLILIGVLGIAVLMLSDKLRFKRKRFISHHFKRPFYDYQQVWAGFTENTASITSINQLCSAITSLVSHTLDVLSVSIWLVDEQQKKIFLRSSTMSEPQFDRQGMSEEAVSRLFETMAVRSVPVDIYGANDEPIEQLREAYHKDFELAKVQYCVPLRAAGELIGLMTLSERVLKEGFSFEDYELLRTISDQAAAALLNLKLSEKLRKAKELEAFQVMSAFFMHDLKNLASKLSLVNQNMPVHFENEEFRQDASRTMGQCVEKIKGMCNRLSLLSQTLRIQPKEVDLNRLVARTIDGMNGQFAANVVKNFGDVPVLMLDDEQMEKVFLNLLINAHEAAGAGGRITLMTSCGLGWAEVSICDNGPGMSREFMDKYLFKPFQTTKKQGMGIGLFHCKTIVEAHGGRIEVESEEGKGTTFRVLLPVKQSVEC